jgi:hypothetical protein
LGREALGNAVGLQEELADGGGFIAERTGETTKTHL